MIKMVVIETTQDARNALDDAAHIVKRALTKHRTGALILPSGADEDLRVAQEALFAALRKIEGML